MTEFWNSIVTVLLAVVGIAALALIVSRQSNTTGVISTGGQAFSSILGTALSPVTGAATGGGLPFLNPTSAQSFPSYA